LLTCDKGLLSQFLHKEYNLKQYNKINPILSMGLHILLSLGPRAWANVSIIQSPTKNEDYVKCGNLN
jgi:hypothetical protein